MGNFRYLIDYYTNYIYNNTDYIYNYTHYIDYYGGFNDTMDASWGEAGLSSPPESAIARFSVSYQRIHGYLSVLVCIFGIVSNVLSIIVLTRKHMRSPTNFILTALAIADMLVMSTYPIRAIYLYIITSPGCMTAQHSRGWIYFILIHYLFIVTCHNISTWLTVTLAVFRYIFVCLHAIAARMCSMARAKLAVAVVVVAAIVSCVPLYLAYSVQYIRSWLSRYVSCYWIVNSQLMQANPTYAQFLLSLFAVVIKILPCVMMAFLSTRLIIAIQQAKKRRARLFNTMSRIVDNDHQSSEHNRTTMMLLGVVICSIVTEIPQGIILIWAVDEDFLNDVYFHLVELMEILVLVNSAVNFILYCIMSQQFRNTFKSLFVCNSIPFNLDCINLQANANGTDLSMVQIETTDV